jgi:hypothetical protein
MEEKRKNCPFCQKNYKNHITWKQHLRNTHYTDACQSGLIQSKTIPIQQQINAEELEELINPPVKRPKFERQISPIMDEFNSNSSLFKTNVKTSLNLRDEMLVNLALKNFKSTQEKFFQIGANVPAFWSQRFQEIDEYILHLKEKTVDGKIELQEEINNLERELICGEFYLAGIFLLQQEIKKEYNLI